MSSMSCKQSIATITTQWLRYVHAQLNDQGTFPFVQNEGKVIWKTKEDYYDLILTVREDFWWPIRKTRSRGDIKMVPKNQE